MAEFPNHLAKLLSEFLLDYSKAKLEGLDRHPLIETPVMQRLTAEYLARQPAHRTLPARDVAMGALGEYWSQVFKPAQLTLAFRDEWRQYLLLAVAYFALHRRRQGGSRVIQNRLAYPQSYGKLGGLLSDADYLADVLAEETAHQYEPNRIAEFCRTLVPNANDLDKGAKPATTVASSRGVAIAALARSLEDYTKRPIQAPTEPDSPQVASPTTTIGAAGSQTELTMSVELAAPPAPEVTRPHDATVVTDIETAGADERQLPALLSLLDHSLARWELATDSLTLAARARRLAQQLAAIRLGVVPTAEPTTDLTGRNVQLALRWAGAVTEDWSSSDQVLDYLAQSRLLRRDGDRWGFSHPALELFFAAEHLADDREHWVSLQPRHHRLMRWTAAVLARRSDDRRNDRFCQNLGRALRGWSPVSLLDVADILAQFRYAHTRATLRFQDWLGTKLKELAEVRSGWLSCRLWQYRQELGIDLELQVPDRPQETLVPPATLEAERLATDLPEFLSQLGLSPSLASRLDWYEDRHALQSLLNCLTGGSDVTSRLPAAAWLRYASLETHVELVVDHSRLWNTHRATALEVVAEMATNRNLNEQARALARGVLATDAHLLGLAASDCDDRALLYTLELMLDVRLFFSQHQGAWLVYSGAT